MNTVLLLIGLLILAEVLGLWLKKRKRRRELLKRQRIRGEEGELETARLLEGMRGHFELLHHVYLPIGEGRTTELDLLMIHEKGLIVIENKNYSGFIYGRGSETYWMQVRERGEKRSFYSPVRQNEGHIRHLRAFLGQEAVPIWSVITFNERGQLRRVRVSRKTALVCSAVRVRRKLFWYLFWKRRVLNRRQVEELASFLRREAGQTKRIQKRHEKQMERAARRL